MKNGAADKRKANKLASALGLVRLGVTYAQAGMELARAVEAMYPAGSTIRADLQHGQINPSVGEVLEHRFAQPGYLRVRFTRKCVRDVHFTKVQE